MKENKKIFDLVLTALLMCIVCIATMFIRIPVPMAQGYVHLGDSMIFLAVLILGKKNGAIAAGIGSCMADILGGWAAFAPWTLVVKFLMALVMGIFSDLANHEDKTRFFRLRVLDIIGMVLGGLTMVAGYFAVECYLYGTVAAAAEVFANVGQFTVGMIIAVIFAEALCKTPIRQYFYKKA